jgi:alkanesulfonate monooxygenase SsuD/methylene tetrahydromethanopterin reductase-like flavin-dependent oxidoreductase (luciferase family)
VTQLGLFVDVRRLEGSGRSFASQTARVLSWLSGAEELGLDAVWFTEHHGFADGYLPQPMVFAAAVAARTSRVRLGTAVVLAPLRPPRHLAEEAALVDVISGGRFELGLGAGYSPREYELFGLDFRTRFQVTDATAVEVERLLAGGDVTPAPVQERLPLWLGYQAPRGARRAGRLGLGLLSLDRALLEPYLEGLGEGGHAEEQARMGGLVDIIVADDPDAAIQRLLPHWLHQQNTYRALRLGPDGSPLAPLDAERARATLDRTGRLGTLQVLAVDGAVAELRARLHGMPAQHVYAWLSLADMPDDLVERHVELWCGPVRDAIRGHDATVT